jgi:hypothetical protein
MLPFNVPIWYNLIYIMLELSVKALYIITIKKENTIMTNRYGNPIQARFYNNGYLSVDRDTKNGKFVSKTKAKTSWFQRILNIF